MAILMAVENLAYKTHKNIRDYLPTFLFNHPGIIHTTNQPSKNLLVYGVTHYFALNLVPCSCVFLQTDVSQKHTSLLQELLNYFLTNFDKIKSTGTTA